MFDHLRLSCNVADMYLCVKYQHASGAVCAHVWKQPECALIGACALIRRNTVADVRLVILNLL